MKLVATGCSVIGPAHLQDNQPNQDAVMIHRLQKGWCIAVCDGLGSKTYSHIGSKQAVQLVRSALRKQCSEPSYGPLPISLDIQEWWLSELGNDATNFATTCLWSQVQSDGKGKAAQVGDGLLLVKANGVLHIITPQRTSFGNETKTIADATAEDWSLVEFQLTRAGDGVLIMTDGISDDLISDQLEGFFDVIYQQLKKTNKRRCKRWLTKELKEWSTPKHGDDKSIAGIFRIE